MTRRLLFTGHSHIACVGHALRELKRDQDPLLAGVEIKVVQLREEQFQPERRVENGHCVLTEEFKSAFIDAVEGYDPDVVVTAVNGQYPVIASLTEHPQPFRIGEGEEPSDGSLERIPFGVFKAQLRSVYEETIRPYLVFFDEVFACPVVAVAAPPPVREEEHILENPGPFKDRLTANGVMPFAHRLLALQMDREILSLGAQELGLRTLDPPPGVTDPEGGLEPDFLHRDPVHGNARYGEALIRQVLDVNDWAETPGRGM